MDYPYIRAWGWMLGSSSAYINDEVARAKQQGQPQDVLYERVEAGGVKTGEWPRFNDRIVPLPATTVMGLEQAAANHGITLPHQKAPANQQ